jgi:hypothetical protein
MDGIRALVATVSIALIAAATLVTGAPEASAGAASTITIHHRLCPTDVAITDYFTQCHDNLADQSFAFTLQSDSDDQTVESDAATGNATIVTTPDTVEIFGGVPGEFAKTFVYCSQDGTGIDVATTGMGVSFDAPAGEIVCDWYNTPIDLSGNGGTDNGGVTALPNTGIGPNGSDSTELFALLFLGLGVVATATIVAGRRHA